MIWYEANQGQPINALEGLYYGDAVGSRSTLLSKVENKINDY